MSDCACGICSGVEPADESDGNRVQQVRDHGWSVVGVLGTAADFAYTVGLQHSFGRPEVAVFGLDAEDMLEWLNSCVDHALDRGWPPDGEPFTGVLDGARVQLRTMHPSWDDSLFGTAERFYGRPVPVRQLVWPDRNGNWPWEAGASHACRAQPRGWLPVAEHPPGGWRLVAELSDGFPFDVEPDAPVLTTAAVRDGHRPVASVMRDEGAFDVLDDRGYRADDLCLAFLGSLVQRHPELVRCADLADGQVAVVDAGGGWTRSAFLARRRRLSERSWQDLPPVAHHPADTGDAPPPP